MLETLRLVQGLLTALSEKRHGRVLTLRLLVLKVEDIVHRVDTVETDDEQRGGNHHAEGIEAGPEPVARNVADNHLPGEGQAGPQRLVALEEGLAADLRRLGTHGFRRMNAGSAVGGQRRAEQGKNHGDAQGLGQDVGIDARAKYGEGVELDVHSDHGAGEPLAHDEPADAAEQ